MRQIGVGVAREKRLSWGILAIALMLGSSHTSFAADAESLVSRREAVLIAKNFVAFNAAGHFPEWQNAGRFAAKRVFSTDGTLVSYEVSVTSEDGNKLGFVVVAAQKGNGEVVTAFSSDGESESDNLERFFAKVLRPAFEEASIKPTGKTLIGTSTGAYAIGVKFNHHYAALHDVPIEGGYYLFSPEPGIATLSFTYKDKQDRNRKLAGQEEYAEELELRTALLTGDFSSILFQEQSSGTIDGLAKAAASISGTFSSFYQEKRAWTKGGLTNGTCYAGCTPVAWAIVLEYWDRNGYPKMISSSTDNSNSSTTDSDVRWTINELRGWLKTTCTSDYSGSTTYWNATRGMYYAQSRGYSSSSASNTYIWSAWWALLSAVDSKKPPIATLDASGDKVADHSAVVYSYTDNWGTSNDSYCFRTGWSSPTSKCFVTQNALYGLTSIYVK